MPRWQAQRSLVTSALAGPTAPWPRLRFASTSAGRHLLPASQLRRASFISAASRVVGRMGGRVVGLGAVGAGGAAYVGSQVDGLFTQVGNAYRDATGKLEEVLVGAAQSADRLGQRASAGLSSLSASLYTSASAARDRAASFWQGANREQGSDQDRPDVESGSATAVGVLAAPLLVDDTAPPVAGYVDPTNGLMALTRRLIEIRTLLLSIDQDESLVLPSIVVIGSQSSGKSSVLEAVVGHEFLPKGNNMVTRRPLELTLIHTPPTASAPEPKDFAECPQFGPGRFDDFGEVQRRLTRLNLDVPDSVAVEDSPIHLRVYSPNVPDLSLVDLPGYVQISSLDQPEELREKISALCDKYIRKPNVILAVSAADVDLANSPALRASRRADPQGQRTIGVVTKLDLVDPLVGAAALANEKYRLALGYVGVVCKPPPPAERSLLRRASPRTSDRARQEALFFQAHAEQYLQPDMLVGVDTLKRRLMAVLERSMGESLHGVSNKVSLELEEAAYQFKVQYNDRPVTAASYVAETLDAFKGRVAQLARMFNKPRVRALIGHELEEKVQDLLADVYWSDRRCVELAASSDVKSMSPDVLAYWDQRVDTAQSLLAKSGIGRYATEVVADELRSAMVKLVGQNPLQFHPQSVDRILALTDDILEDLHARAADHVEIAVTPFRYEIEVDKTAWENARLKASALMEREVAMCEGFLAREQADLRRNWRLREALEFVREQDERRRVATPGDEEGAEEDVRPPPVLMDRARRIQGLDKQLRTLKSRQAALKSRRCRTDPANKAFCPEVFLQVVAERLSATAADFINIDLLQRYFAAMPNEVNGSIHKELEGPPGESFARQNPEVRRHLDLQDRKDKLERVMRELTTIAHLQDQADGTKKEHDGRRRRRGYFSNLF